jgi:hypothetical protein
VLLADGGDDGGAPIGLLVVDVFVEPGGAPGIGLLVVDVFVEPGGGPATGADVVVVFVEPGGGPATGADVVVVFVEPGGGPATGADVVVVFVEPGGGPATGVDIVDGCGDATDVCAATSNVSERHSAAKRKKLNEKTESCITKLVYFLCVSVVQSFSRAQKVVT